MMMPDGPTPHEHAYRARPRRPLVLVVEDTWDQRTLFVDELRSAGFAVLEAADGEAAVDAALRSSPQAIVLDLMLPGLSGFNVARLLRANVLTQDSTIVAVTALTSDAFRVQALGAGCDSVLRKPVIGAAVVSEIVRLLAKRRAPPGSTAPDA
jgi:two-component system NtrC family sensor kinase